LAEHQSGLMVSVTGSTDEASLIGNAMERGLGTGAYGDRAAHACDLEVVLATGEVLRTGFGRYDGAAASVSAWGVGPSLDGLFTQSNLGIVTRMTFWLMPKSTHQHFVYFMTTPEMLEPLVDALRRLRLLRICDEPVRLYNDYKMLSGTIQFPKQAAQNPGFISPPLMSSIREALNIGAWCGEIYIDADSEAQRHVQQELVYTALKDLTETLYFVESYGIKLTPTQSSAETGELRLEPRSAVEGAHRLETPGGIRNAYWRKKTPVPEKMDPDHDACGVFWCAPAVPFTGSHVARAVGCMETTMLAGRYEPIISIILLTERCAIVNASLIYDREEPGEDERALECYHTLLQNLLGLGYIPYRLGIQSMDSLPAPSGDYNEVMARIKSALDPNNILAPGRYELKGSIG
ncbi:MAG: FAD-binding oxidoreductase, partial [Chloroflexia bacterium]